MMLAGWETFPAYVIGAYGLWIRWFEQSGSNEIARRLEMITKEGELTLLTGKMNGELADPISLLTLEFHKNYPDITNVVETVVTAIQEYGTPEDALDAFRNGDFELVMRKSCLN